MFAGNIDTPHSRHQCLGIIDTVTGAFADVGSFGLSESMLKPAMAVDTDGRVVQTVHPDPATARILDWTEWRIPLDALSAMDLSQVASITLGIGGQGKGTTYFDNLRVGTPRP